MHVVSVGIRRQHVTIAWWMLTSSTMLVEFNELEAWHVALLLRCTLACSSATAASAAADGAAPESLFVASAGNSHHCLVDGNIFSNAGDGVLCLAGARFNQISNNNVFDNPGLVNK